MQGQPPNLWGGFATGKVFLANASTLVAMSVRSCPVQSDPVHAQKAGIRIGPAGSTVGKGTGWELC